MRGWFWAGTAVTLALLASAANSREWEFQTDCPFPEIEYRTSSGAWKAVRPVAPMTFKVADEDIVKLEVRARRYETFLKDRALRATVPNNIQPPPTVTSEPETNWARPAAAGGLLLLMATLAASYRLRRSKDTEVLDLQLKHHQEAEELRAQATYYRADGLPPERIDQFEVLKKLGQGGIATVYLVKHPEGTLGALKLPVQQLACDLEFRKRFWQEMTLGARLRHPGIVRIDYVSPPGSEAVPPYYVMEKLEGQPLDEVPVPLPSGQALGYARELLDALSYMHQQGVVHRDLKPTNIWMLPSGHLKVLDFGLALLTEEDRTRLTASGLVLGTPAYMAPEQLHGSSVDARADLFALGIIVYELLSGRLEQPKDAMALLYKRAHQDLPPLCLPDRPTPVGLQQWLQRLTARQADQRFGSADEARQALEELGEL